METRREKTLGRHASVFLREDMGNDPFLAIGMVSAPQNFERRRSVRRDMLDLPSVRTGAIVFRFLLGRVSPMARFVFGSYEEFQAECTHNGDVLLLNSLNGFITADPTVPARTQVTSRR